jgi:hypothetical protein
MHEEAGIHIPQSYPSIPERTPRQRADSLIPQLSYLLCLAQNSIATRALSYRGRLPANHEGLGCFAQNKLRRCQDQTHANDKTAV